jgi:protein tyrosine/serine phosphatase
MNSKKKIIVIFIAAIILIISGMYIYQVHFNYRFRTVENEKVYRSGVIPPSKLPDYLKKYHIKSVIDLRSPETGKFLDNPEKSEDVLSEKKTIEKISGTNYYNIKSDQIPTQNNLDSFYKIMDKPENYPVLIHCYHGVGRAGIYSAIYQIEYQKVSNEEAQKNTRSFIELRPLIFSSFDNGKAKGEFLKNYKPRSKKQK